MLGFYYKFCRSVLTNPKSHIKTLYYIDLYCGDGETYDPKTKESYDTAFITSLAKDGVKEMGLNIRFLLNDINPESIDKLKAKLISLGVDKNIIDINCGDANEYIEKALKLVPKNEWSIFFLDPFNYKDLKWETIKKISNHSNGPTRKPELIINLPIYTLNMGYESKNYDSIDKFFGDRSWLDRIETYKLTNLPRPNTQAFLDVFVEKLKSLGYQVKSVSVPTIDTNSPVYFMIFAIANPKGFKIAERALNNVEKLKEDWKKEKIIKAVRAKAKIEYGKTLEDF